MHKNTREFEANSNFRRNVEDGMIRGSNANLEDSFQSELKLMMREQHNGDFIIDRERDLNIFRSGSAPPTVEGSLSAVGSLFRNPNSARIDHCSISADGQLSEEELRSHPAYLSYYYSHENLNPRLPPPLLSREDWRVVQRFQAGGLSFEGIGDLRKNNLVGVGSSSSLFSMQPSLSVQEAEDELMELRKAASRNLSQKSSAEWLDRGTNGLIGLSGAELGTRRKSFADILQEGLEQPASLSGHFSHPSSRSSFGDIVDTSGFSSRHPAELCNVVEATEALHHGATNPGLPRVWSFGSAVSHSFASSVAASLSRSRTPEPQLIGRSSSPGLPPVGNRVFQVEKKNIIGSNSLNCHSSSMTELADVAASLSSFSLSRNELSHDDSLMQSQLQMGFNKPNHLLDMRNGHKHSLHQPFIGKSKAEKLTIPTSYINIKMKNGIVTDQNVSELGFDGKMNFPQTPYSSGDFYSTKNPSGITSSEASKIHCQTDNFSSMDFTGYIPSRCSVSKELNRAIGNHFETGSTYTGGRNVQNLCSSNQEASDLHTPHIDPLYIQYLQKTSDYAMHAAVSSGGPSQGRNYFGASRDQGDLQGLQNAYLEALLAQQKNQYGAPVLHKSDGLNHGYYANPTFDIGLLNQGNALAKSVLPSVGSGVPMFQDEQMLHFNSMLTSSMGGSRSLHSDVGNNMESVIVSSLLEELKNKKTKSVELSDIVDNVVEFSTDQYGSRFIQQKLETATVEEKTQIFPEIVPHALVLVTDVFGNYVIQKFFEHGTDSQRKELANQLSGHILPLSLQMYGCRVIQKALEVVGVEQQTQLIAELDGSVMKCVRDQNGNHVIQKCIECVPQDRLQFIISAFFGQVVALSTHPYGCRVIQRVLEHCDDPETQQTIMGEIMHSVCTLAQDQYGNYVIQHVLQHGKPQERSTVINKLAGQIVKMSQQKFASNVVEKCLIFGGSEERQLLVKEILGSTDQNEPLQAMMKDPFGNYVVQKVLETCNDQSHELILSRIKVHLTALKRYTYGKHIVSRVEKLITTGEKRSGLTFSYSS